jgi:hypothetical protein
MFSFSSPDFDGTPWCDVCEIDVLIWEILFGELISVDTFISESGLFYLWVCSFCKAGNFTFVPYYIFSYFTS